MMKKLKYVFVSVVVFLTVLILGTGIAGEQSPQKLANGNVFIPEGTWRLEEDAEEPGVVFESRLPERQDGQAWTLMLKSHWKNYEILSDGERIYRSEGQRNGAYHLFSLGEGTELTIRFLGGNDRSASAIEQSGIWIGTHNAMNMMLIRQNSYAAFFFVFALLMGAAGVILGVWMRNIWNRNICHCLVNLGLYILCAGVWILTDSKLLLLVTQKTGIVEQISFLAFFCLPLPLLEFTGRMMHEKKKMFRIFQYVFCVMLLICMLHELTGRIAISVVIVAEHICMVALIVLILHYGIREIRRNRDRKVFRMMLGYIVFGVCSIVAFVFFYRGNALAYSVSYMIAMLGFILLLTDAACIAIYEQIRENANVELYAKMAYVDRMTELGNRAAFMEEEKENASFTGTLAYIVMDANNLKFINDTQGHQKGDELIIQIADCLKRVVSGYGNCYRTGGDEFVACIKDHTRQEVEACIQAVRRELELADSQSELPLTAAMGYAWTDIPKKNLDELLKQADEAMYKNKKEMKHNI